MAVVNVGSPQLDGDSTMSNSSPSAGGVGNTAVNDDSASSITVNTKTPATFPPPKTDKPRPHVCTTCQRSFARLEHLKRHERSHTKEKPFECPECTRCFARRDLLLRHQQKLHQTTTPSSRPRNRRESTSSTAPGQSRARKNSVAGVPGATASAAGPMRPRANTISHVDGNALLMASASVGRGIPPTHSRHPSLVGLPLHGLDHSHHPHHHHHHAYGMASAMGQRGIAHGLPKLETHGMGVDYSTGLRTAPPMAVFSPHFDFEGMLFGHNAGSTINPSALHYSDSPQSMALDPTSPFSHGLHDMSGGQPSFEDLEWLAGGFDQRISFNGPNDTAVDGSSPSAISTTSQSGISDVMLDGSNHPAVTSAAAAAAAAASTSMWPPAVMGPPQMGNQFSLDLNGSVFPDLMGGAPVSPQPPPPMPPSQKNSLADAMSEAYFSTPVAASSMGTLSPSVLSLNPQSLHRTLSLGTGPETPTSINGSSHGTSPVSTITDSTRNAILGALASAASQNPFSPRNKFSFNDPTSPLSPHSQSAVNGSAAAAAAADHQIPSTHDLQRYVQAYLKYFHPHLPFLHIPTLSFDIPTATTAQASSAPRPSNTGGSGCLILSMAAIGALYELHHDQSKALFAMAKKMIQLYLDERRKATVRKAEFLRTPVSEQSPQKQDSSSVETPVWLVQAMLLNVIYGHNCADQRAGEIASTHCAALVSLAQGAELLRPRKADGSGGGVDDQDVAMDGTDGVWADDSKMKAREQAQWLKWKTGEEQKRTLYAIFILSSLLVSAYNHTPALTNSEILLDLPCDEEFFSAPNSASFFAKGGAAAANHNRMSFRDALGELLKTNEKQQKLAFSNGSGTHQQQQQQAFGSAAAGGSGDLPATELKPSTFGCLILINALHNYIWETRQRHHNKIWTNEETEKMHRHIEPALKAWQAAWASNPHHSLHRPNPFGKGPLSADAIPLLDLAYVRLFVNLSRSKEKFWQRDWSGLAEELSRGDEIVQHAEHSPASNAESNTTDPSDNSGASSVFVDSPPTQGSSPEFAGAKFSSPRAAQPNNNNGSGSGSGGGAAQPNNGGSQSQMSGSTRSTSRREKHLRKAAFYAADSLSMSGKLGVTFADFTSRELPLQSAMCAFDCAQVLAEWVATLQDRVGRYLGVLGRDDVDLTQVPAIMLLEDEDVKLLSKIQDVLGDLEMKMKSDLIRGLSSMNTRLDLAEQSGYAAKILCVTAFMLERSAVWPVTRLMAECLEHHAFRVHERSVRSVMACA